MSYRQMSKLLFIALSLVFFATILTGSASAHGPITINGNANEWLTGFGTGGCPALPATNSLVTYTTASGCTTTNGAGGENIWTDATGDQRTDHWNGTGNMDMTQFRMTFDRQNVYFLVRFSDITNCAAQYIQVALNNSSTTSGLTALPDGMETNLSVEWDVVIETNTTSTGYWTDASTYTPGGTSFCSASNDLWEISMPRVALNLVNVTPSFGLRVAIACNNSGTPCETSGSDVMDVMTTTGPNTFDEVGDGTINSNFIPAIRFGLCASYPFPYTMTTTTQSELVDAIQCANDNGAGADTINLNSQTVSLIAATPFADYSGQTGLPQITSDITIRNGTIFHDMSGGGFLFRTFSIASSGTLNIQNVVLDGASAPTPGGAFHNSGTLNVTNSTMHGYDTSNRGGVLYNASGATANFANSLFYNNRAVFAHVMDNAGTVNIINSTFDKHTSVGQFGFILEGSGYVVRNSIIWNTNNQGLISSGNTVSDSIVKGGYSGGTNILNTDPLFVNEGSNDFRIQLTSPAVNVGVNSYVPLDTTDVDGDSNTSENRPDLDLNPRIVATTVDMGAYERQDADPCAVYTFPYTMTGNTPTELQQAITCANTNGAGADVISLNGQTVTLTDSFADYSGATGLPQITTNITLRNGTITRNGSNLFRIVSVNASGTLSLRDITISNGGGSGYSSLGAGIHNLGSTTVTNSNIINNTGNRAVALYSSNTLNIVNSTIAGNFASQYTAILDMSGTASITNSVISGNKSTTSDNIWINSGTLTVTNSTVAYNYTAVGASTASGAFFKFPAATLIIQNSIVWGNRNSNNSGDQIEVSSGTPTVSNSIIEGGIFGGINADPLFVTPIAVLSTPTTTGNFQLNHFSPAIDAGANANVPLDTYDVDGDSNTSEEALDRALVARRYNDTGVTDTGTGTAPIVDMGAYERQTNSDVCAAYIFPYTLTGNTPAELRQAITCANANGAGADSINLNGQTVTLTDSFGNFSGATGLPQVTTNITVRNGTITRTGANEFRFFYVSNTGNLTVRDMTLTNGGGAAYVNDGGTIASGGSSSTLTVVNTTISGSRVDNLRNGSAIYSNAIFTIVNSSVVGGGFGRGAIASNNGPALIQNTLIAGNSGPTTINGAGGVYFANMASATIENSTIVGNYTDSSLSTQPGGVFASGGTVNLTIRNSIIWGNRNIGNTALQVVNTTPGTNTVTNSIIEGGIFGALNSDPLFITPITGSSTPTTAGNFQLGNSSPAIDAGANANVPLDTYDVDGDSNTSEEAVDRALATRRVNDTGVTDTGTGTAPIVDIGAYEKQTNSTLPSVTFTGVNTGTSLSESSTTGDSYTVQITSTPSIGNAVIVIDPNVDCEVSINGSGFGTSVTITTNNPATVFNVEVRAVNDRILEGTHTCSVSYTFSGSAAPEYASITRANDVYSVSDNENAVYGLVRADGTVSLTTTASESVTSAAIGMILQVNYGAGSSGPIGIDSNFSVGYTQTGGTATGGGLDYSFTNGSVNFLTTDTFTDLGYGWLVKPINFTVVDDTLAEATETVVITADPDESGTSGTYDTAIIVSTGNFHQHTYNIIDNDAPNLTQSSTTASVTESGTTATYTLTLTNAAAGVTANTTITAGADCEVSLDGTTFFSNVVATLSNSATTVTVRAVNDQIVEGTQNCTISHSNTSGSAVSAWNGIAITNVTATVTDNDTVTYQYSSTAGSGAESVNASATIELVFSTNGSGGNDIDSAFTVTRATLNGTATAGTDYTTTIVSVMFVPGGPFSQVVSVPVNNDTIDESDETFTMYVDSNEIGTSGSYAAAITLGTNQNFVYTIVDDDNAGVGITESGGSTTVTEGSTTDTYTVVLNTQPTANVTITVTGDAQASVSPTSLTFTTGNWNIAQTVTVTAVDDSIAEGAHTGTITHSAAGGGYNAVSIANVTANITDNDSVGVTFSGVSTGTTLDENQSVTDSYTVQITTTPSSGNAVIVIDPDVDCEVSINSSAFGTSGTITTNNPATAFNVVVRAVNDRILEGGHTCTVSYNFSGSTATEYASITRANDVYSVTDNEIAIYALIRADGTTTTSTTASESVTSAAIGMLLQLDYDNLGTGPIGIDSAFSIGYSQTGGTATGGGVDYSFSNGAITFTPADTFTDTGFGYSNLIKPINFTVVNDTFAEATETVIVTPDANETGTSGSYAAIITLAGGVHTYNITDNDVAGITFTGVNTSSALLEDTGNTDNYTVQLTSTPASNVAITIDPDVDCHVSIDGSSSFGTAGQALTINATDLTVYNVSVRAFNDFLLEGPQTCSVSYTFSSADSAYNAITRPTDAYNVTDDESGLYGVTAAGFALSSSGSENVTPATFLMYLTVEGSGTGSILVETPFSVGYNISVGTATGGGVDYTLPAGSVTFNNLTTFSGFNGFASFTASIVNDAFDEPDETFTIVPAANETGTTGVYDTSISLSGAPQFQSHTYTILDNDVASITKGTPSTLALNESPFPTVSTTSFSIGATPLGNVNVLIVFSSTDDCEISLNGGATWTQGPIFPALSLTGPAYTGTVSVRAYNDRLLEGAESCLVSYTSTSSDPAYSGLSIASSTFTIADDESATVAFQNATLTVGEASGTTNQNVVLTITGTGTGTYTLGTGFTVSGVVGATSGTANITADASMSDAIFSFASGSVNSATDTVAFAVVDDSIDEADEDFALSFGSVTNATASGTTTETVTITDNDTAGVSVVESDGSTNVTEGAATDTYTVVLNTQPTADVTVTVTGDAQASVSPTTLTFTTGNWNIAQTVTVTAVNDLVAEGAHTGTITHSAAGGGYTGVTITNVTANITDNDVVGVTFTGVDTATVFNESNTTGDAYTVQINTTPSSGNVNITIDPDDDCQVSIDGGSIYGTAGQAQTITTNDPAAVFDVRLQAFNDRILEAGHTCTVSYTFSAPGDPAYNSLTRANDVYTVTDNESVDYGLIIIPNPLTFSSGAESVASPAIYVYLAMGGTGSGTVDIAAPVTVGYSVSGGTATGGGEDYTFVNGSRTFNPGTTFTTTTTGVNITYSTPLDLTIVDDILVENNETIIITADPNETGTSGDYDAIINRNVIGFAIHTYTIIDNDTPSITLTQSAGSTDINESGPTTDTYTLTLSNAASGVTTNTTITADANCEVSTDGTNFFASVVATLSNSPTTITVRAVDDLIDESTTHPCVITHSNTSGSSLSVWNGVAISTVTANVTDNDTTGVSIAGAPVSVTEGGATDSYDVVLTSQPTADVTITVTGDAQASASPTSLTFTTGNWNIAQTVTVTAVNDSIAEGAHTGTITHSAAGGGYNAVSIANVTANITDNDTAGVSIVESDGSTNVTEAGVTDTYTVVLNTQPTADVTVTVTGDAQASVSPLTLTFTTVNWNIAQTVTVTAVNDVVAEGAHTGTITHSASGGGYNAVSIASVTANITDNDTAGVSIVESDGSTNVTEAGVTDTYTVVLNTQPTADVTVTVTGDAQASASPLTLTFTTVNWNIAQTVTVTAVNDVVAEGAHTGTITHSAAGGGYGAVSIANVTANITDNDIAGVSITESGGSTNVTEGGATDTYTVVLNTQPTADVTITVTGDAQASASPLTLTFTTVNWNIAQTVTVTAVNDVVAEGAHTGTITHSAAGGGYGAVSIANVTANITDNDTAGVSIVESDGSTNVTEAGVTDTYTVVLNTQPTADVTVTVTGDAQASVSPTTLTFTTANWNIAQTVTVTAVNDAIAEGAHTGTITHSAAGGGYGAVSIANVTANITDNDTAGVSIVESDGSTNVTEGGATDTYTVVLNTQPTADVTITVTGDAQASVSPLTLTFTTVNWNIAQTVTVTAVNDVVAEGAHTGTITHSAAGGGYGAVSIANVTANITDNDTAGVSIVESDGSTNVTEAGVTDTYTVVLNTQPTAAVTVTVTGDAQASVSPLTLTFTTVNWNIGQTVTVTAVNDVVAEGAHTGTITHSAAGGGYNAVVIANVTANITDNDTAGVSIVESDGSTNVTEAGVTDTYTVVLNTQPTADVTVTVTGDAQASVSPLTLTFTTVNWNIAQTVTVTAVNDAIAEGAHTGTITHSAAGGGYGAVSIANVTANITDNDTAGVSITPTTADVTEGGATDTYTVVLTSQPTATVTVTVTGDAQASVSPLTLTFTTANWNIAQTVTVTAVNDVVAEGAHTGTITHSAAGGGYGAVSIANVTANITDNDIAAPVNLLLNPSFEEANGTKQRKAANWTARNATNKDRRLCVGGTMPVTPADGNCAFQFSFVGPSNVSRSLKQIITAPAWGDAGDTLTLSAQISGSKFKPAAKMVLQVRYTDGTKAKVTVLTPTKTFGYTEISGTLDLTKRVQKVIVNFNIGLSGGRLWIDDTELLLNAPLSPRATPENILPLPTSPDGFRGGN